LNTSSCEPATLHCHAQRSDSGSSRAHPGTGCRRRTRLCAIHQRQDHRQRTHPTTQATAVHPRVPGAPVPASGCGLLAAAPPHDSAGVAATGTLHAGPGRRRPGVRGRGSGWQFPDTLQSPDLSGASGKAQSTSHPIRKTRATQPVR
jgi:hypothetical protein